jgi:uncharacterized protein
MDITRIAPQDRQHIQKYGQSGFTVSGNSFPGAVLVFADQTVEWLARSPDSLKLEDFGAIFERSDAVDLCLLGSGKSTVQVPGDLRTALKQRGLAIEPMDTGAACRTFNVLLAEGRAVMAALFVPESD